MADKGFHEGELAVQRRAGVAAQAERLGTAMLATPDLNGGIIASWLTATSRSSLRATPTAGCGYLRSSRRWDSSTRMIARCVSTPRRVAVIHCRASRQVSPLACLSSNSRPGVGFG